MTQLGEDPKNKRGVMCPWTAESAAEGHVITDLEELFHKDPVSSNKLQFVWH